MKMKILVIVSALCVGILGVAGVASAMPPKHKPDFNRLAEELQVTAAQKDEFVAIMKEQHRERISLQQSLRQQDREQHKARMDELKEALIGKLQAVLTAEQLEAFTAHMEKRRQQIKKYRLLNAQ